MDTETIQEFTKNLQRTGTHQYKLVLPDDMFEQLQQLAERESTTMADLIRRAIKLFLVLANEFEQEPDAELIIQHENKPDRHILFIV